MVTLATNQNCSMNSRTWKGRRKVSRHTVPASANSRPVSRSGAVSLLGRGASGAFLGTGAGAGVRSSGGPGGITGMGAVTGAHPPRPGCSC